jgi:hypothetical protein
MTLSKTAGLTTPQCMKSGFILPNTTSTQSVIHNSPFEQVFFCWKKVVAGFPHEDLDRVWDFKGPNYLPNLILCIRGGAFTTLTLLFPSQDDKRYEPRKYHLRYPTKPVDQEEKKGK